MKTLFQNYIHCCVEFCFIDFQSKKYRLKPCHKTDDKIVASHVQKLAPGDAFFSASVVFSATTVLVTPLMKNPISTLWVTTTQLRCMKRIGLFLRQLLSDLGFLIITCVDCSVHQLLLPEISFEVQLTVCFLQVELLNKLKYKFKNVTIN